MRPSTKKSRLPAFAGDRPNRDILRVALFRLPLAAAFFFLAAVALAQPPRATITGPRESRPGALVVLDASESVGTGRLWLLAVSPEETSFLPVESGLKCIFASPTPGKYTFVLVVSGTNANGGAAADMATHSIVLTGSPPITPPVIPPPVDPTDPTVPALLTGPAYLVVIRNSSDLTADQAAMLLRLRAWADSNPSLASLLEFSPDEDDQRLAGYKAKAGPLPWFVVSRARKDGSGAAILWSVSLPASDAIVRAKVEEVTK